MPDRTQLQSRRNRRAPGGRATAAFLALVFALSCTTAPTPSPALRSARKVALAQPAAPPASSVERGKKLTAAARRMAGLPASPDEPASTLEATPDWQAFSAEMVRLRDLQEERRMSRIRPWADANLADVRKVTETVLYPFGGPDAVYPTTLFPNAKTYVLVGLESCGRELDPAALPPKEASQLLGVILQLVSPFYKESYFITRDMEAELKGHGVFPVLMVFLAGEGASIADACPVTIDAAGKLVRLPPGTTLPKGSVHGVAIDFVRSPDAPVQTLLYFSQNLADDGLAKHPEFATFLGSQSNPSTFLKAASYLLWNKEFRTLREFLLSRSLAVLEDDSGVPYRYFKADEWDVRLFGCYVNPVDTFRRSHQPDLTKAYQQAEAVPPLDFGMGYHRQAARCNLQLAMRRRTFQAAGPTPAPTSAQPVRKET